MVPRQLLQALVESIGNTADMQGIHPGAFLDGEDGMDGCIWQLKGWLRSIPLTFKVHLYYLFK